MIIYFTEMIKMSIRWVMIKFPLKTTLAIIIIVIIIVLFKMKFAI